MDTAHQIVADTFRREADRILASLISSVKDFELAEDALQEAMLVALERWPVDGIPRNPSAWITTTARHKAIDRLRRTSTLARKQVLLQELVEREEQRGTEEMEDRAIPDERLKLMFTCCHPALSLEAQVALTLHTLGGGIYARDCQRIPGPVANDGTAPGTSQAQDTGCGYSLSRAGGRSLRGTCRRGTLSALPHFQ